MQGLVASRPSSAKPCRSEGGVALAAEHPQQAVVAVPSRSERTGRAAASWRRERSYAGPAPITVAFGKSLVVHQRKVKNQRLAAVVKSGSSERYCRAGSKSPDRRRAAGDKHAAAVRNLFNRFLGCLHHCLETGRPSTRPRRSRAPQRRGPHPRPLDR